MMEEVNNRLSCHTCNRKKSTARFSSYGLSMTTRFIFWNSINFFGGSCCLLNSVVSDEVYASEQVTVRWL